MAAGRQTSRAAPPVRHWRASRCSHRGSPEHATRSDPAKTTRTASSSAATDAGPGAATPGTPPGCERSEETSAARSSDATPPAARPPPTQPQPADASTLPGRLAPARDQHGHCPVRPPAADSRSHPLTPPMIAHPADSTSEQPRTHCPQPVDSSPAWVRRRSTDGSSEPVGRQAAQTGRLVPVAAFGRSGWPWRSVNRRAATIGVRTTSCTGARAVAVVRRRPCPRTAT